jgi:hypothetical protein
MGGPAMKKELKNESISGNYQKPQKTYIIWAKARKT